MIVGLIFGVLAVFIFLADFIYFARDMFCFRVFVVLFFFSFWLFWAFFLIGIIFYYFWLYVIIIFFILSVLYVSVKDFREDT